MKQETIQKQWCTDLRQQSKGNDIQTRQHPNKTNPMRMQQNKHKSNENATEQTQIQ